MRCEAAFELVYATIADLRNHLDWSGDRAADEKFKLLSLEAPAGPAAVGTSFTSSGSAENGTFHDRSEVTVATPPTAFVIERVNYVPYWLQPGIRSIFKVYVNRADRKQLANLARLAEERAGG